MDQLTAVTICGNGVFQNNAPADARDPYPDYIDPPLFNLPGGFKPSKWTGFQK